MRSYRAIVAYVSGFVLLALGILMLSPLKTEVCDKATTDAQHDCPAYHIVLVAVWKIGEIINDSVFVTALATIAIAAFTYTLKKSTDKLFSAAKESADAAKLSAEALISAEQAHLFITIQKESVGKLVSMHGRYNKSDSMFYAEVDSPGLVYFFYNFGRTGAILTELSDQIIVAPTCMQPPTYTVRATMPDDLVIEQGKPSASLGCVMAETFTVGKCVAFQNRETAVWFYGYAKLKDAFGRLRQYEYRFCYRRGYGGFRLEYFRDWEPEKKAEK